MGQQQNPGSIRRITLLTLALAVSACGGGGGSSSTDTGDTPTATPTTSPTDSPTDNAATQPTTSPTNPSTNPSTAPPATVDDPNTTEIKLLVLMSHGLGGLYADPELRVNHLVNFSNRILSDSGVNLVLSVAHLADVSYPDGLDIETALNDLTGANHNTLAEVANWRTAAGADLVVLMRPYANDGRCGIAWIGGHLTNGDLRNSKAYGYSVVSPNCSDYTLLHEVGHNLGLAHSRGESASAGSLDYGRGYGENASFATIMASPAHYNAPRVPRFSSPLIDCVGSPCGISYANPNQGADAVQALKQTMDQVAAYEP